MKTFAMSLVLLAAVAAQAHAETAPEARALRVSVTGTGPAVEADVYQQVRDLLAGAFADGTLDNILTLGHGIEGGAIFCVELNPWVESTQIQALKTAIDAIRFDPTRSYVDAEPRVSCQD
jgi:hypothetical protein